MAWWLLGEKIIRTQLIGGAVVIIGILLFMGVHKRIKNLLNQKMNLWSSKSEKEEA
ncbi:hypothetical protein JOC78_001413 [Bacillus ectoiniformans]|nr:hypothetical protein [Bacillus ectoiniformans]